MKKLLLSLALLVLTSAQAVEQKICDSKVIVFSDKGVKDKDLVKLEEWLSKSQKALTVYKNFLTVRKAYPMVIRKCEDNAELLKLTGLKNIVKDGQLYVIVAACDIKARVVYLTKIDSDDLWHELGHWYLEKIKGYDAEEAKADDFMDFCHKLKEEKK